MRLMTVRLGDDVEPVLLRGADELLPLRAGGWSSVRELVEAGEEAWSELEAGPAWDPIAKLADVDAVLPPIPQTLRNAMCVGSNYQSHVAEGDRPAGTQAPPVPVLFSKAWTTFSGHDADIPLHVGRTAKPDWEAEIVVVIGRGGIDIAEDDALDHVFGYALGNDASARDLQKAAGPLFSQWFKGKNLDLFGPIGPYVTTAAEVPDPTVIEVELTVNGVVRQSFCAKDMVNSIGRIVSYLSLGMRLYPGDVIFTGTSSGVGLWHDPPIFLEDGDVVEITSPQLGVLRNRFVADPGGST